MNSDERRDVATKVGLGLVSLVALSLVGGLFYLQRQASVPQVTIRSNLADPSPRLVSEVEQRKRERILELREKWQVWAKAHQDQLRSMMRSQPDDLDKMHMVSSIIPGFPDKAVTGIEPEDIALSPSTKLSDPIVLDIEWAYGGRNATLDPSVPVEKQQKLQKELDDFKVHIQKREDLAFEKMHDVRVVDISSARSEKSYILWATGKITESKLPVPTRGAVYRVVAPSYDFLSL